MEIFKIMRGGMETTRDCLLLTLSSSVRKKKGHQVKADMAGLKPRHGSAVEVPVSACCGCQKVMGVPGEPGYSQREGIS